MNGSSLLLRISQLPGGNAAAYIDVHGDRQFCNCFLADTVAAAVREAFGLLFRGLNMTNVEPLGDVLMIEPEPAEKKRGNIWLPDSDNPKPTFGTVLAAGPGKVNDQTGKLLPTTVRVGERVILPEYRGHHFDLDGKKVIFFREDDLLGVFRE